LLDFSLTMLDLSRTRLQTFGDRVSYLRADFKQAGWERNIAPYDCIVTIQAVHELRHKRYAPDFYKACRTCLKSGGLLLVCDHLPKNDSERDRVLFMSEEEQIAAIEGAGFSNVAILLQKPERLACRAIA
jgi:cyclopropane fatty-acyl-phospholipid synthase-like methyltransferase